MDVEISVLPVRPDPEHPVDVLATLTGVRAVDVVTQDVTSAHGDFVQEPAQWLHLLSTPRRSATIMAVALRGRRSRLDGVHSSDVLGFASASLPLAHNEHLIEALQVRVLPAVRRRGIGTRLIEEIVAQAPGRTHLVGFQGIPLAEPGEAGALISRTDPIAGRLTPDAEFAVELGFTVAQIERYSCLDVPDSPATPTTPPGYRLVSWVGPTPPEFLPGVAALLGVFETDQPVGDIAADPAPWDAEALAAIEAAHADRLIRSATIAVHEASGETVAATRIIRQVAREASAEQGITVVRGDHRGHGLGLAIKRANLVCARQAWPLLRRIHTWNAGENDHMWAINQALGFRTMGAEASWQKRIVPQPH